MSQDKKVVAEMKLSLSE
jgi:hypothetical protein